MEFPYNPEPSFVYQQQEFHRNAVALLNYLCDPGFDDEPTRLATYAALGAWQHLEDHAWEVHDTSEPHNPIDAFRHHLINFHVALPFAEAEREWLVENVAFYGGPGEIEDQLAYKSQIVSEGVHKVVAAHDMVRRWLAWRQQAGEYSGQGTLDQARTALAFITRNVVPYEPLPESYMKLSLWPEK
jgi:hypothetical protein